MRVKIFKGTSVDSIERDINSWLESLPQGTPIAETQTSATVANNRNGSAIVHTIVSIWYGDLQDHTKRLS